MEYKTLHAQDVYGNALKEAICTVYVAGTTNLAAVFDSLGNAKSNPFLSGATDGSITFAAADGLYDINVVTAGHNSTIQSVQLLSIAGVTESIAAAKELATTHYAATKSAGDTLASSLPDGATVIVTADESQGGVRVRYTVASAALTSPVIDDANRANGYRVDNIAELRLYEPDNDGDVAQVTSYYAGWAALAAGPSGGGRFVWDASSTATDDGGSVIAVTGVATGRWRRIFSAITSVKDFGAVGDGVTDDAAAIQAALNSGAKTVRAGGGVYAFSSQLNVPAYVIFDGDGKYATILNKTFNGDALILGTGAALRDINITGNGGIYTGRGILINSGATNQVIDNCRITDFSDYCLEFTAASAGSGFQMTPGTEISRTTPGDVAIKLPVDVSASPRKFTGVNASSAVLIDTNGADNTLITGCFARNIIFGAASAKVICTGNRLATLGSNCVINGVNQVFTGNDVAGIIEAGVSLTSSTISGNYPGPVIDNSRSRSNTIDNVYFDFTPVWSAASVNPSLGNGTLTGRLVRVNRLVKVSMYLSIGSTTTTGTGVWTFVLPASLSWMTASKLSIGSCYGLRSGVNFQVGVAIGNTDPATFGVVLLSHAGGNNWGPTVPVTWASGDYVRMDVEFELA